MELNPYEWFAAPCKFPNGEVRYYVQRYVRDERQGEATRESLTLADADRTAARWNAGGKIDRATIRTYL